MERTVKQIRATNKQKRDAFLSGAKLNGVYGMQVFLGELNDWIDTGDWRGMHDLVARSVHSDQKQSRVMLAEILDPSWKYTGKGFVRDKKKAAEISNSNERGMYVDGVLKFAKMCADGMSFRGYARIKAEDGRSEDEKTQAAYAKMLAALIKMGERTGKSIDAMANDARVLKAAEDAKGNAA